MSIFGASATPAPSAFGGFGSTNQNQQQPSTGTGLFGAPSGASQPATGSAFGSTNTNQPAAGSAFGGTGTSSTTTGGGLFGSNTNQGSSTGGLFGNSNANAAPATTGGTGLFGNTAGTSTGAGLFGNTSTQSNQTASGSLFGASITTQPASTGLFGNSTTTSQPATGNSLFGSNSQPLATRSLFGNSNTAGGGTFGSTNNNTGGGGGIFGSTAPAQGGGIFGQSNQQQQQQQQQQQPQSQALNQSALFGRPNATGLYASTLTVPASLAASIGGSTLGGGFKGRGAMIPAPVGPVDPATQFMQLSAKLEGVQKAWDSRNPECRFQYPFYNLVDPAQINLYGRPPNATNEALWVKAVQENPDPSCLVPVIATGFDDLQQRVEAQTQTSNLHQQKLEDLKKRLAALGDRHALSNAPRQQRAAQMQTQLLHRIAKLCSHLHLLIPVLRASAIRPEEEGLRAALDSLSQEIRGTTASSGDRQQIGRLRARLNELWALLGAAQAARGRGATKDGRWAVVDEDGLRELAQILGDQQAGLAHLTQMLQKDLRDLAIIEGTETRDGGGRVADPASALATSLGQSAMH